jgi:Flp pilus assembly protein TadG
MYLRNCFRPRPISAWVAARASALASNERGATAVEFAFVIGPFLFLLLGIISVGFYFFVMFSLENAVESASRVIRTGQAQTSSPPMTVAQFKSLVCSKLPPFMPCGSSDKIRVNVQNFTGYGSITTPPCTDSSGNLIPSSSQVYNPGGASTVVLVSVCYEWELTKAMANVPYWISPKNAKMSNGSTMMQASTAFTSEPYN